MGNRITPRHRKPAISPSFHGPRLLDSAIIINHTAISLGDKWKIWTYHVFIRRQLQSYVASMIRFQLRDLLSLTFVAGVFMVWLLHVNQGVSADALLDAKLAADKLSLPASTMNPLPPITDTELIEKLGLDDWVETPEWVGSPLSPYRGQDIIIDVSWLEAPVAIYWKMDAGDPNVQIVWDADWGQIKTRRDLMRKGFLLRVILTGLAIASLAWLYKPQKIAT